MLIILNIYLRQLCKSLQNPLTCDHKYLFAVSYTLFYFYTLFMQYTQQLKQLSISNFVIVAKDGLF